MFLFLIASAFAQEPSPQCSYYTDTTQTQNHIYSASTEDMFYDVTSFGHGPDKPPPSDGYEFKGKGGGGGKAKLGTLLLLSSSIPALSSLRYDKGSPTQIQKTNKAMYMAGIGIGLILWDRFD